MRVANAYRMLFNSSAFLCFFFPAVLLGFFVLGRVRPRWATTWLAAASLFFYGYWSLWAVPILLASVAVNYAAGIAIDRWSGRRARAVLVFAVTANLLLLGFFKYADFFVANANVVFDAANMSRWPSPKVVLPIGISFYTFTQIAFLVDCSRGEVKERNPVHYLLFVTYFPHLVAGPVLHHRQMMPQFADPQIRRPHADAIALGFAMLIVGLAKKLLLADALGAYATGVFELASQGNVLSAARSWLGVFAYTFQIYYDFSGYSDMAIGVSLFLGVRLPLNFDSPYKSTSIIDFWRRWHITLSAFLRDYLYIPLGGETERARCGAT